MKLQSFSLLSALGLVIAMPAPTAWAHGREVGAGHLLEDITTDRTASIPNPPRGKISMRLSHTYVQNPLPGIARKTHGSMCFRCIDAWHCP